MKKACISILSTALLLSATCAYAEEAAKSGAEVGEWTQDYDAAVKLAQEKKLPMLLNFSGSDWCGWCKLMVKNVFSKKEWQDYAKENIVLVLVDFPKDKSLVPEKFRDRNEALQDQFGVRGFPTFIILDCDGKTQLGKLGASREATPKSFIADLSKNLTYCVGEVEKYASKLKGADKAEYMGLMKKLSANKKGIAGAKKSIAEAKKQIEELEEQTDAIKAEATEFRAAQKGEAALKEYKAMKAKHDQAKQELDDWLESSPKQNKENYEKMQKMRQNIRELNDKLSAF